MRTKIADVISALGMIAWLMGMFLWIPVWWIVVPFLVLTWLDFEVESLQTGLLVASGAVIGVCGALAMWRRFLGDA
jgi:hypothetical protein